MEAQWYHEPVNPHPSRRYLDAYLIRVHAASPEREAKRMESAQRVTFGQLLRRYRLAARLTQEQLAALAGIGVRSIGDLERDVSRAPHAETLDCSLTP